MAVSAISVVARKPTNLSNCTIKLVIFERGQQHLLRGGKPPKPFCPHQRSPLLPLSRCDCLGRAAREKAIVPLTASAFLISAADPHLGLGCVPLNLDGMAIYAFFILFDQASCLPERFLRITLTWRITP